MRKLAITMALASTALATPAVARDHSWYAGIEGGAMLVENQDVRARFIDSTQTTQTVDQALRLRYKTGFDVDVIAGYDFGMIRLEGELGYKRASTSDISVDSLRFIKLPLATASLDTSGRVSAISGMINGLVDFGNDDGWSGYAGPGVGYADVKTRVNLDYTAVVPANAATVNAFDTAFSQSNGSLAWQVVAGFRYARSEERR